MTVNPLLQTLRLIDKLSRSPASAETLGMHLHASPSTLKRYVAEARVLGADIRSVRAAGGWLYELRNADSVMTRTKTWMDLEQKRSLI